MNSNNKGKKVKQISLILLLLIILKIELLSQERYIIEIDTVINLSEYNSSNMQIDINRVLKSDKIPIFLKNVIELTKPISIRKMLSNINSDIRILKTKNGEDFDITRYHKKYIFTTKSPLDESTKNLALMNDHIIGIYEDQKLTLCNWPPNDEHWQEQVQYYSTPYNINLPLAWNYTDGNSGIKIGVFDDGVYYNHEDFGGGFGYGFRVRGGYDFFEYDPDPGPDGIEDFHGTNVAGILGALNNNNTIGVVGIAGGWTTVISGCQLFAFRIASPHDGHDVSYSAATEAIIEAASDPSINGGFGYNIDIMNFSWGTYGFGWPPSTTHLDFYYACVFAYFNNVVMSAAKGNDNTSVPFYPANYSNANLLLSVSGVQNNGTIHPDSNYGDGVSISAPYTSNKTTGVNSSNDYDGPINGTSFATPYVAGTAALIYSKFLERGITILNDDAMEIIKLSAEETGDPFHYGAGRLNSGDALSLCSDEYNLEHLIANINRTVTTVSNPPGGILSLYYPFNSYVVAETKRIRGTARIPDGYNLSETWTWANSYSEGYEWGNPSYGMPRSTFVSQNGRDVVYEMYVYRMIPIGGGLLSWYPTDPFSADINVSILGKYTPIVPPIISHFTQSPDPICINSYGYVYVHLSQGNGDLDYNWYSYDQPSYINITPLGNRCKVTYLNTENPVGDGPLWDFGCTVTNSVGSSSLSYTPNLDPNCSGCPTLAFEDEGNLVNENPMLITSLSNPGIDVTDYYLINTEIEPESDEINFTIHEPQTEHTWLDQVELIEAIVKSDELVAVNDDGEVINYKKTTAPVTVMLNGTTDITEILSESDTLDISLSEGDVLTIYREELLFGDDEDGDIVLGGSVPAKEEESLRIRLAGKKDSDGEIKSNEDDNPSLGELFFRKNKSIIAKKLRNLPPGDLEIVINKDLVLDYLAVVKNIRTARTKSLTLLSANHIQSGEVKDLLLGIDQNYVEIYPGERTDFIFRKGNTPAHKREYILKTVGRYETDTTLAFNKLISTSKNSLIPKENKLFDNYPNPFNPTTQIKYSVKENGLVALKVYDVLGNEVIELVNEEKPAGTYTAEFNAAKLSSGIYFYTISANDFQQTKKMILIK